jgi:zinc D-Ala-D-Ala carboxypeptidase
MRDLKLGDTGDDVRELQKLLAGIAPGKGIDVDGDFGPQTDAAVRRFQASQGPDTDPHVIYTVVLVEDGIVGPKTMGSLTQAYDMAHS